MAAIGNHISRISKVAIDRNRTDPDAALAKRRAYGVTLRCGDDVAASYTLQLAVLTAARIGCRCFPDAVRVVLTPALAGSPLLIWPWLRRTFGEALVEILGPSALAPRSDTPENRTLLFGSAAAVPGALRVTFDGWIAKCGPAREMARLPEREFFPAAGMLAAALALSELFLSFAGIGLDATRRVVGMSLWRPDLSAEDDAALGLPVEYLPRALWVLGLGHLGNAYLWALATLPYEAPDDVEFALMDFDRVEMANVETGVLLGADDVGSFKARACDAWLRGRMFRTRLVERRFDATFRVQDAEPKLALCGFDANSARRDLPHAQFRRVIDCGLGGTAGNFDTIGLHTLPNPRPADELWPEIGEEERAKLAAYNERMARENPGYRRLGADECGRRDLADKAVAVPFVGVAAASLAIAEMVRLLHDGPAFFDVRMALGIGERRLVRRAPDYTPEDTAGLDFSRARLICESETGKELP